MNNLVALVGGFIGILVLIWIYFIPYHIGHVRGVGHTGLLFLGNLFFGASVLGWFIALIYACAGESAMERKRRLDVQDRILCAVGHGRLDPPPLRRV